MSNLIFGLSVKDALKTEILKNSNYHCQYIDFDTLEYVEIYIASQYIVGCGFMEDAKKIIHENWKLLTRHTYYSPEVIHMSMLETLHKILDESLYIELYHNCPTSSDSNNLEQYKKEATRELELLYYFLDEAIIDEILIESSPRYTPKQEKHSLERTYNLLNSFTKFKDNDDFLKLLTHFNTLTQNKSNFFIKKIRLSKLNYFACNKSYGLFYIHLVNIIYAFYIISDFLESYQSITTQLKNIIKDIDAAKDSLSISNIIYGLSKFKNNINSNQVLQYVSIYYYNNILSSSTNFDAYKALVALIFDKDPYKLFLNPLPIEKTDKPFEFLYHSNLLHQEESFPSTIHVWQLCHDKELID